MGDAGYKRWLNTKWWSEDYSRLWENEEDTSQSVTDIRLIRADLSSNNGEKEDPSGYATTSNEATQRPTQTNTPKSTVIYLTADSEDELSELKPDETYVIGGICDHNRYKVIFTLLL